MKRRRVLQTILGAPAAAAATPSQAAQSPATTSEQPSKLATVALDAAAEGVHRFFSPAQYTALEKLADLLIPAFGERPSARAAGAVEFLDFLIGESPAPVRQLYQGGLDRLVRENFTQLGAEEAGRLLAPLKEPWSYAGPVDSFSKFLVEAKIALYQATLNSREFAEASSRGRRGASGMNYYWRSLE